jgi:hypothetical protein
MTMDDMVDALAQVFGQFLPEHGSPAAELDRAAQRLGSALPAGLRTLYLRTGRHPLHQAHNSLLAAEALRIENDCLIFYNEQQASCTWGIERRALALPDPPVVTCVQEAARVTVLHEFSSLAQFFAIQAALQAIDGALPFVGVILWPLELADGRQLIPKVTVSPERFAQAGELLARNDDAEVRMRAGTLALSQSGGYLGLAARDADTFRAQQAVLGVSLEQWDHATLRDG